jgi:hypothetical protein
MINFDNDEEARNWVDDFVAYSKISGAFLESILKGPDGKGIHENASIGSQWTDEAAALLFENCCISYGADSEKMMEMNTMGDQARKATLAKALRVLGVSMSDFQKHL